MFEINIQERKGNFEKSGNSEMNDDNVFVFTEDTRNEYFADKGFSVDIPYGWLAFDLHQILEDILCYPGDFDEDNNPNKRKKTATMYSKKSNNLKSKQRSTQNCGPFKIQTK